MSYHFTLKSMAINKKKYVGNKCGKDVEKV